MIRDNKEAVLLLRKHGFKTVFMDDDIRTAGGGKR